MSVCPRRMRVSNFIETDASSTRPGHKLDAPRSDGTRCCARRNWLCCSRHRLGETLEPRGFFVLARLQMSNFVSTVSTAPELDNTKKCTDGVQNSRSSWTRNRIRPRRCLSTCPGARSSDLSCERDRACLACRVRRAVRSRSDDRSMERPVPTTSAGPAPCREGDNLRFRRNQTVDRCLSFGSERRVLGFVPPP